MIMIIKKQQKGRENWKKERKRNVDRDHQQYFAWFSGVSRLSSDSLSCCSPADAKKETL